MLLPECVIEWLCYCVAVVVSDCYCVTVVVSDCYCVTVVVSDLVNLLVSYLRLSDCVTA